ncbi:MAG TPA: SpoIIE family protein phosphatase [Actinomycetota bacterium]|nr:SpoIIE family protein phosphatase [Actinomycetota bacterium]
MERPAATFWRELVLGPGLRRVLLGLVAAAVAPIALTPVAVALDGPLGIYVVAIIPGALIGRLVPGAVAAALSFVLATIYLGPEPRGFAPTTSDWIVLVLFLGVAVLVAAEEAARASARAGQRRLAFLAEANRTLTTSLDVDETLDALTRLAVPVLGDWCAVEARTSGDQASRFHAAHADPTRVARLEALLRRYPRSADPQGIGAQVVASGRPVLLRKVNDALLRRAARDEEHLRMLKELRLRSALVVPLIGRGRPMGTLTLATAESGRRLGQSDLDFAVELARTTALAIENASLHQERSVVARTLQSSLLPAEIPEIPGLEVAVRYRAAGGRELVGGDFYDVFEAGDGTWGVALGDVCGKGPEAAALTGLVRHTIRTAAVGGRTPSSVLELVNRQIIRNKVDRFCTATLGRIRRSNGSVHVDVSCGGHPPPLIYRPGRTVEAADCLGSLLGVFPEPSLAEVLVDLEPGDAIVFYTDGLTERFEREGTGGDSQLVALLWDSDGLDADQIADRIYLDAAEATGEGPRDDLALVVLRVRPG